MSAREQTPWRSPQDPEATEVLADPEATQVLEPDAEPHWGAEDPNATRVLSTEAAGHRDAGDPQATRVLEDPEATRPLAPAERPRTGRRAAAGWAEAPLSASAGASGPARRDAWEHGEQHGPAQVLSGEQLRDAIVRRQKEEYARVQLLPGLIGWLVALPLTGFLAWLAGIVLPALGAGAAPGSAGAALSSLGAGQADAGPWALAYAVAAFLGYLGGGYAAGRAARFGGAKQGVGVFLWFLMITAVASIAVQALGVDAVPGTMPVAAQEFGGANLGWTGLTVAGTALIALGASALGGLWGTAYHRRADRWGFQAF